MAMSLVSVTNSLSQFYEGQDTNPLFHSHNPSCRMSKHFLPGVRNNIYVYIHSQCTYIVCVYYLRGKDTLLIFMIVYSTQNVSKFPVMATALMTCSRCDKATGQVIAQDGLSGQYGHWEYMQCPQCEMKWHICMYHLRAWPWENTGKALKHFMTRHPTTEPAITFPTPETNPFHLGTSLPDSDTSNHICVDDNDNGSQIDSSAHDSMDIKSCDLELASLPASNEWESLASRSPWQSTPLSFQPSIVAETCNNNDIMPVAKRPCSINKGTIQDLFSNAIMPPQAVPTS